MDPISVLCRWEKIFTTELTHLNWVLCKTHLKWNKGKHSINLYFCKWKTSSLYMKNFPREFYLVTGLATIIFITSTVIAPFFSLYVVENGATSLEPGLIVSIISFTTLLVRLPLAFLIGRIGSWWVMPLAMGGQVWLYLTDVQQNQTMERHHLITTEVLYLISSAPTWFEDW